MDNHISIQELYQIIGQKDVLIYKLEQEIAKLQERIAHLEAVANGK